MAEKYYTKNNPVQFSAEGNGYATIRVIGVGGGGCNAVNRMIEQGVQGIEFIAINTDYQALDRCSANNRIQIGEKITHGLGAGADPSVGEKAADENRDEIASAIRGTDLLFITAGMGGGTGSGAAPVVAEIADDLGILTVAVVTKPFRFEGAQRMQNAEAAIRGIERYVDSLIVVPNDKLLEMADDDTGLGEAFSMADQVLKYGVTGISDLVAVPGLINLDLADVRRVMVDAGVCHMGIGRAKGQGRMEMAVNEALHSPLLDTSIDGAHRLIVNFTGSNLKLREVNEASSLIRDSASPDADIIIGAVLDASLEDEVMITVIASGFEVGADRRGMASISSDRNSDSQSANPFSVPDLGGEEERGDVPAFLNSSSSPSYPQGRGRSTEFTRPNMDYSRFGAPGESNSGNENAVPFNGGRQQDAAPKKGADRQTPDDTLSGKKGRILPWFFNDNDDFNE